MPAKSRAKRCSDRCKAAATHTKPGVWMGHTWKQRRRAKGLPYGARITPSVGDIVQRDGLDCHICLEPIDYTLPWQDGASLTVDHLIPVSDIRSFHGLENLKLAHRRCNLNRSDSLYNDRNAA
jgi:5-methylcytosine-specific restriction endonuclease McrA